jgi:hypothetical protein
VNFKKLTVHILLGATFISGLALFVSNQTGTIKKHSIETQKFLHFFKDLIGDTPQKKADGSISQSSTPNEASAGSSLNSDQSLIYEMASEDFQNLKNTSDRRLFNVQSISWQIRDSEIYKQNLEKSLSIIIDKKSTLALEIEVFSQSEKSEKLTIVQLSYTDISNGNKVHEFSRMYQTSEKKPD